MKIKKRGDIVISNVLEFIIAVICIGLIVYFVFYLYNAIVNQKNNAIASVESIVGKLNIMEEREIQRIAVKGPCSSEECPWYLAAYSTTQINKPSKCFDKSCLCICKEGSDCQVGGYCKATNVRDIVLSGPRSQFAPNILEQNDYTRFKLRSNFRTVEAEKIGDLITLYVTD